MQNSPYEMLFGDHFFRHNLVSMLLSLNIDSALTSLLFREAAHNKKYHRGRHNRLNNHFHTSRY